MSIATHSSSVAGGMNRKPLILVYGDSIALPRQSEGIAPEDTMAELLAAHYAELGRPRSLYNRSDSGKTITDHRSKYEHEVGLFSAGREDLFIFQGGVVDCAPRPLPPRLRRKLERKPAFIRKPIIAFLKAKRPLLLRWGMSFRKVEPAAFQSRAQEWFADAARRFGQVVIFELPPVNAAAESHSPGWQDSIVLYNRLLAEVVSSIEDSRVLLVPLHQWLWNRRDDIDSYICPTDGHHLAKQGQRAAFELLRESLKL
jgi:hypothetical protein